MLNETPLASVNQTPRELTKQEVQKLVNDAWAALNMRLAPGRLHQSSFHRLDQHAGMNFLSTLTQAKAAIFSNYREAVRLYAEALFQSVRALMYEPSIATQKTFDPLALEWIVEPPVIAQRRARVRENLGLAPVEPASVPNYTEREKEAADKAATQKAHQKAVRDIDRAIDGIVFQNFRGYDNAEMERVKTDLRKYVKENLGKNNSVKVLNTIRQAIAGAHQAYERKQQAWNNR